MNELHSYFEQLKEKFSLPEDFELKWIPDSNSRCEGTVTDSAVYIFDTNLEKAKKTLQHEILDLLVTKLHFALNDPSIVKNENEAYYMKEAVIERILSFISENDQDGDRGLKEKLKRVTKELEEFKTELGYYKKMKNEIRSRQKPATKEDLEKAKEKVRRLKLK